MALDGTDTLGNVQLIHDLIAHRDELQTKLAAAERERDELRAKIAVWEPVIEAVHPDKLDALAEWFDFQFPDDDNPEVQQYLRNLAQMKRALAAAREGE